MTGFYSWLWILSFALLILKARASILQKSVSCDFLSSDDYVPFFTSCHFAFSLDSIDMAGLACGTPRPIPTIIPRLRNRALAKNYWDKKRPQESRAKAQRVPSYDGNYGQSSMTGGLTFASPDLYHAWRCDSFYGVQYPPTSNIIRVPSDDGYYGCESVNNGWK